MISISIVSHEQCRLVAPLLSDLSAYVGALKFEVLLTLNVPEDVPFKVEDFSFPIRFIVNDSPVGFGSNHNSAFSQASGKWFCVLNPDIRLMSNPFPLLLGEIERLNGAVIAPITFSSLGKCEDSVRHFPTMLSLVKKAFSIDDGRYHFSVGDETFPADWVGGMFMLFRVNDFRRLGGFDEKFFLYYEDVDICARLWRSGGRVLACPSAGVIHNAQRASRHNARYMSWHASSMLRYFAKHWLRLPRII